MDNKQDDLSVGNDDSQRSNPEPDKKPIYHHGSTTQGGSNFGQGSSNLGNESYKQGDTANRGSNYDNEKWEADDVNTGSDTPPVGDE